MNRHRRRPVATAVSLLVVAVTFSACAAATGTTRVTSAVLIPGHAPALAGESTITESAITEGAVDESADAEPAVDVDAEAGVEAEAGFVLQLPADVASPPTSADADLSRVQAAFGSVENTSYRAEVKMSVSFGHAGGEVEVGSDGPYVVEEVNGARTRTLVDMGALLQALAATFPDDAGDVFEGLPDDLTMESITDGTTNYLRAPGLVALARGTGEPLPPELRSLSSGWGRVDLATVSGISATELAELVGGTGVGSGEFVAYGSLINGAVLDLGTEKINGVQTSRYQAIVVNVAAAIERAAPETTDRQRLALGGAQELFPNGMVMDVHIDDRDRLRRLTMSVIVPGSPSAGSLLSAVTIDFSKHGEEIDIAIPADAVDITADFL